MPAGVTGTASLNRAGLLMRLDRMLPTRLAAAVGLGAAFLATVTTLNSCAADAGAPDLTEIGSAPVLRILPREATVQPGDSVEFGAWVYVAGDSGLVDVVWSSSAPEFRVTGKGKGWFKGRQSGKFQLTATLDTLADTVTVTVLQRPVASVQVVPSTAEMAVGQGMTFVAQVRDSAGVQLSDRVLSWSSSSPSVASVDNSGRVQAKAVGSATITATSEGQTGLAEVSVAGTPPPQTGLWRAHEPSGAVAFLDYDASDVVPEGSGVSAGPFTVWYNQNAYSGEGLTRVTSQDGPVSAPNAWQVFFPRGFPPGSAPATANITTNVGPSLYLALYVKFSSPFTAAAANAQKFIYLWAGNSNFTLQATRMVDQGVLSQPSGSDDFRPTGGTPFNIYAHLGEWVLYEWVMDASAQTIDVYVNGGLWTHHTGITGWPRAWTRYSFYMGTGGSGNAPAQDQWVWVDHFYASAW